MKTCHLRLVTISFAFCAKVKGKQRARENGPENPAASRPTRMQIDSIHVAVRTTVLDRKNVNEMNNGPNIY